MTDIGEQSGKLKVRAVAKQAEREGWIAPAGFDVVEYFQDTYNAVLQRHVEALHLSTAGSRFERKVGRKLAHTIGAMIESLDRAVDVERIVRPENPTAKPDIELFARDLVATACRWRAEMALGACSLPTARRATLVINACERLVSEVVRQELVPIAYADEARICVGGVGRAPTRVASGERASRPASDERGERAGKGYSVDGVVEGERVRGNEEEEVGGAARTTGARVADARTREGG